MMAAPSSRAARDQLARMFQRTIEMQEAPAIGKRIRRDIDDPHDQRPLQGKSPLAAMPASRTDQVLVGGPRRRPTRGPHAGCAAPWTPPPGAAAGPTGAAAPPD